MNGYEIDVTDYVFMKKKIECSHRTGFVRQSQVE